MIHSHLIWTMVESLCLLFYEILLPFISMRNFFIEIVGWIVFSFCKELYKDLLNMSHKIEDILLVWTLERYDWRALNNNRNESDSFEEPSRKILLKISNDVVTNLKKRNRELTVFLVGMFPLLHIHSHYNQGYQLLIVYCSCLVVHQV